MRREARRQAQAQLEKAKVKPSVLRQALCMSCWVRDEPPVAVPPEVHMWSLWRKRGTRNGMYFLPLTEKGSVIYGWSCLLCCFIIQATCFRGWMVYLDTQKGSLNMQRGKTPSNIKRILLQFFQETISLLRKTDILQANVYSLRQQFFSQILLPRCFMMAFFLYLQNGLHYAFQK